MNPIQKQLLVYGAAAMVATVSEGVAHSSLVSGTGFFITGDGYLISNYHVVKDAAQVRVVTSNARLPANVVQVDAANDLALLKVEGNFSPLPVAKSSTVSLGATVATIGFPDPVLQGFNPKLAKGEIAALSGIQDDPREFQISVPVQPGNSGGALVDEHGNVVGIVSAKLNEAAALVESGALPENVNYAVKSSLLLKFLASVPEVSAKLKPPNTNQEKFEDVVKSAEDAAVLLLVTQNGTAQENPSDRLASGSPPDGSGAPSAAEFESEFYARYPYLKPYAITARWAANQLAANGLRGTKDEVMQAFASATMEEIRQFNSRVEQLQNMANDITPLPQFNEAPPDAGNAYAMANYIERQNAAVDRYEQQKAALKQVEQKIQLVKQEETEKCGQGGQMELGQAGIMALATPEEIAAAAARAGIARQQQQTQVQLANERALKFDQDLAAKGDGFGLLRMAERYRDGDGVEKDLTKARDYFNKAIAAGSPTAADELKELPNAVQK